MSEPTTPTGKKALQQNAAASWFKTGTLVIDAKHILAIEAEAREQGAREERARWESLMRQHPLARGETLLALAAAAKEASE